MRRDLRVALIGLWSWLLACASPLSPNEALELGRAKQRWAARGFQDYSFEYQVSCGFCARYFYQTTRVSVANGQVVGVVYVANDSALAQEVWAYFPTIDSLFASIPRYKDVDWVKDVKVEYDPELGYPTVIATIPKSGIADVGGAEYVSNLVPTPVYEAFGVARAMKSRSGPSRAN